MGRFDDNRDEWQKEHDTDFDWKETPADDHPKKCTCPKHEYWHSFMKTNKEIPILLKYCPDHYKAWFETQDEMYRLTKWWKAIILKFFFRIGAFKIHKLTYALSADCIWCRFGGGGRGRKIDPLTPDLP